MKRRWIYIDGVAYEAGTEPQSQAHQVMPDIEPYVSMIDGSLITSRSKHREHLRQHNCFEVGNEVHHLKPQPLPDVSPQKRHELLRAQVDAVRNEDWKRMVKRDLDRIRWNSRSD